MTHLTQDDVDVIVHRAESPEAIGVRALAADWSRLAAERDALRGALAGLAAAADDGEWHDSEDCEVEGRTDCRLCAALATATATAPQAAGTGGDEAPVWAHGVDVTGVYWVLMHRSYEPELRFLSRGLVDGIITPALIGPRLNPAPPGWREAAAELAALDQDQEADHAAQ